MSSHRYEAPSDAIEVISPASSPAPPQDKPQAYQPDMAKANQVESMSVCHFPISFALTFASNYLSRPW